MRRGGSAPAATSPGLPEGTRFSQVPRALVARCHRAGMPARWAVLLLLLSWVEHNGKGSVLAHCPRSEVAGVLGIGERAVSDAVRSLKRKGIIEVCEGGHNGRSTTYRLRVGTAPGDHPTRVDTTPEDVPTKGRTPETRQPTERYDSRGPTYRRVGTTPEDHPQDLSKKGLGKELSEGSDFLSWGGPLKGASPQGHHGSIDDSLLDAARNPKREYHPNYSVDIFKEVGNGE